MSCPDGSGLASSSALAEMIVPGPQKPHCSEPRSSNVFWIGCRCVRLARPSMVTMSRAAAWPARTTGGCTAVAAAAGLAGEHQAGVPRLAVDQHRAGTAVADVAAELGAGELEGVAQQFE